jgi:hypothetical protein
LKNYASFNFNPSFYQNRDYSAGQISDLAEKLEQTEAQLQQSGRVSGFPGGIGGGRGASASQATGTSSSTSGGSSGATSTPAPEKRKVEESPLNKVTRDRYVS